MLLINGRKNGRIDDLVCDLHPLPGLKSLIFHHLDPILTDNIHHKIDTGLVYRGVSQRITTFSVLLGIFQENTTFGLIFNKILTLKTTEYFIFGLIFKLVVPGSL